MKILKNSSLIILSLLLIMSCGDDDVENPNPPNEEEVITTIVLRFSPRAGTVDSVYIWKDEDGPGGNPPSQIDDIVLLLSDDYDLTVEFLNESDPDNIIDITAEVMDEAEDHQVFFTGTAVGNQMNFTYLDEDSNGNPLGLEVEIETIAANNGFLRITLKHQPGIKGPDTGINDGDTDIEVDFNFIVVP